MSKTIWEFPLSLGRTACEMPSFSEILDVQMQRGVVEIWALVNPSESKVTRVFDVFGTGHPVPEAYSFQNFVGTVQDHPHVWHVFEVIAGV